MITRHLNNLLSRLERVNDIGCAEIRDAELRLWYDRQRLTSSIWADIYEKWQEVNGDDAPLLIASSGDLWVFVYGKGLTSTKDSWLRDIKMLAGVGATDEND